MFADPNSLNYKIRVRISLLSIIDPEIKRILKIIMSKFDIVQSDNILGHS
jgi:hypothetical protein